VSLLSLVVISFVLFHAIDGSSSSIMTGMMGKVLSSLIPTSLTHEIRRILSSRCETIPYISPNDAAHYMPPISKFMNNEQPVEPSHVTLCRELVRRNKIALSINQDDADEWSKLSTSFVVHESNENCVDWSSPHHSLMNIISSYVVAYGGRSFGLDYRPNCQHTVGSLESKYDVEFDLTTIQHILPQLPMPVNEQKMGMGELVYTLCGQCLDDHDNLNQNMLSQRQQSSRHCLIFPDVGDVHLERVPSRNNKNSNRPNDMDNSNNFEQEIAVTTSGKKVSTALVAVLPLVSNRLNHAATDYAYHSKIPGHDPMYGVVIYFDAGLSLGLNFQLYLQYIPPTTSHVSILTDPTCVEENMGDMPCIRYGLEFKDYLKSYFKSTQGNGNLPPPGVSFDIVSSTAALFSRMINSHLLICPPGTITCLLPALSKQGNKETVMMETPNKPSTYKWFTYLGADISNVRVVPLSPSQLHNSDENEKRIDQQYAQFKMTDYVSGADDPNFVPSYKAGEIGNGGSVSGGNDGKYERKYEDLEKDDIPGGGVGGWASMNVDALLAETATGAEKASGKLDDPYYGGDDFVTESEKSSSNELMEKGKISMVSAQHSGGKGKYSSSSLLSSKSIGDDTSPINVDALFDW